MSEGQKRRIHMLFAVGAVAFWLAGSLLPL